MPKLLVALSFIGTIAMLWVGGHILLVGSKELGWDWPYARVHRLEGAVHDISGVGGMLGWVVNTAISAVIGFIVGYVVVQIVDRLPSGGNGGGHDGGHGGSHGTATTTHTQAARH